MKNTLLNISLLAAMASSNAWALKVYDAATLEQAINNANSDSSIKRIVFTKNATVILNSPVIYHGEQDLTLVGNNAIIDGSNAGHFTINPEDLTAETEDGTLVFNTAANLKIRNLTVNNSNTRGIVVNIPDDATGSDIKISLNKVRVLNSNLFGLHIDDNADEFDDGILGSAIGIKLKIKNSEFTGNGTGAIDFDGIRVDERAEGDIKALVYNTIIDGNGGDGIELDEAGNGNVEAKFIATSVNGNGFYNEEDLDDGFDIDEADAGNIEVTLIKVEANNNLDEGLDFDEEGAGNVELYFKKISALNNKDEGIKVDEENAGDIEIEFNKVTVNDNGDDGIQVTELESGQIEATLSKVSANHNAKYGIKIEQWFIEDEEISVEEPGELETHKIELMGNSNGDEIKTNNMILD